MADGRLKVIIAGAGIAGLATAIALRRLPGIDVELYERASELKEIGASIALSPNGLRTLEKLGVSNALDDAEAFRGPSGLPMIFRHWKTNEVVSEDHFENVTQYRHQTARFHRAHLHQDLQEHVPRELIHLNKKVSFAAVNEDSVTITFEDGTTATGDMLVGADGIHSKIRKTFVPDYKLQWTGRTFMRTTFDASLVSGIPDLPLDSTHWWGIDHSFFASRLGRNQYTVVGNYDPSAVQDDKYTDPGQVSWDDKGSVDLFRKIYQDWNPVVKALTEATPSIRLFPNYSGQELSTWVFGSRVTLVGDAAHAHGGSHAAGGSLAIDDAYALSLSFQYVLSSTQVSKPTVFQIRRALKLYENVRKEHTGKLIRGVLTQNIQTSPTNDEELRRRMVNRPNTTWLSEHDVEKAFDKAVLAIGGVETTSGTMTAIKL